MGHGEGETASTGGEEDPSHGFTVRLWIVLISLFLFKYCDEGCMVYD
jgi:hypothetical protein